MKSVYAAAAFATPDLMTLDNVVGVGVGYKATHGVTTTQRSVMVLVRKKRTEAMLRTSSIVPTSIGGVPTDVIEVGEVIAQAIGGESCGHYKVTAGTIGVRVIDRVSGEILLLSNNHVIANSNDAWHGDAVLAPGAYDGGMIARDTIGYLRRFEKIYFEGEYPDPQPADPLPPVEQCRIAESVAGIANAAASAVGSRFRLFAVNMLEARAAEAPAPYENEIDAAVASVLEERLAAGIAGIGRVQGMNTAPPLGLYVNKRGRTTGFTRGSIISLSTTIDVGYGGNRKARFKNQMVIQGTDGRFSAGGDSGSLIVDDESRAVGLLYAGTDAITVANPIGAVLAKLGVDLET